MISYVVWNENCSVGDPRIDAQHKQIVELINDMYNLVHEGHAHHTLRECLENLRDYTVAHFALEEEVMQRIGFPETDRHRAVHRAMTERVLLMYSEFLPGSELSLEVFEYLKKWWLGHIMSVDMNYAPYIDR